jgi:hypothetical protein
MVVADRCGIEAFPCRLRMVKVPLQRLHGPPLSVPRAGHEAGMRAHAVNLQVRAWGESLLGGSAGRHFGRPDRAIAGDAKEGVGKRQTDAVQGIAKQLAQQWHQARA